MKEKTGRESGQGLAPADFSTFHLSAFSGMKRIGLLPGKGI
jgi:hypothetical protein